MKLSLVKGFSRRVAAGDSFATFPPTWSEVVRITQNCPHELKSAAWEMLNPEEKCHIHQLKNQHLEKIALSPQVGNKVYWMNCPAHLTNWQPFLITSIQGEEAMLDICAYPVPLAQLQVCSTF